MSETVNTNTPAPGQTFDAEYVKQLRAEAAEWRTKYRDMTASYTELETKVKTVDIRSQIGKELTSRGIKAEAEWVHIQEGKDVATLVSDFAAKHPHLVETSADDKGQLKTTPKIKPIPGVTKQQQHTNVPGIRVNSLDEIKNDPIARSQLRDHYRNLLAQDQRNNRL